MAGPDECYHSAAMEFTERRILPEARRDGQVCRVAPPPLLLREPEFNRWLESEHILTRPSPRRAESFWSKRVQKVGGVGVSIVSDMGFSWFRVVGSREAVHLSYPRRERRIARRHRAEGRGRGANRSKIGLVGAVGGGVRVV